MQNKTVDRDMKCESSWPLFMLRNKQFAEKMHWTIKKSLSVSADKTKIWFVSLEKLFWVFLVQVILMVFWEWLTPG